MAEKILVVDDDVDSLTLIGKMLQRHGYDVATAPSGVQALQKVSGDRPDLIILDLMMPDMDGYEVCNRLRGNPDTKSIPIIMFTAKSLVDDKVKGFEAGADDYLTKPTHPAELASRVRNVLARTAAQRPQRGSADSGAMTIGFLGVKGGVGTTTLATNVAATLQTKEPTILTDIRLGQGSLGMTLGLGRSTGWANLLSRTGEDMTQKLVDAELVAHNSGLKLLLSSIHPRENQIPVNVDNVVAVLKRLRGSARNIVVDLGAGLTKQNIRLAREMDQVVVVVEPYRVPLIMARELLRDLEQIQIPSNRASVVIVNRAQSNVQIPWQEAEQILKHEMLSVIAPASDLAHQASDAGFPMVSFQPTSIFATQISKLTEEIAKHGRAVMQSGQV